MGASYPRPYYARLRLLARSAGHFYYRLGKLSAVYDDCPRVCRAPYADPQNGCPECEYTAYFRTFRKDYERELREEIELRLRQSVTGNTLPKPEAIKALVEEEAARPPSFDSLLSDYTALLGSEELAGAETREADGGHNPAWTVRVAEGIRVIREERRRVRRYYDKERAAEFEARLAALGRSH